jgi:hypothetical protein
MTRTPNKSPYARAADKTFRHGVDCDLTGSDFAAALVWATDRELAPWDMKHGADLTGRWFQFAGRFYFPDHGTAETFRRQFGGRLWSLEDLSDRQMLIAQEREIFRARREPD